MGQRGREFLQRLLWVGVLSRRSLKNKLELFKHGVLGSRENVEKGKVMGDVCHLRKCLRPGWNICAGTPTKTHFRWYNTHDLSAMSPTLWGRAGPIHNQKILQLADHGVLRMVWNISVPFLSGLWTICSIHLLGASGASFCYIPPSQYPSATPCPP